MTQRPLLILALVFGFITLAQSIGCASFRAAKLYQRGTEELNQGRLGVALRDLTAAAKLAPEASEIQNHLGLAHAEAGQEDRALVAFERAVELDCRNTAAVENLDRAKTRQERWRAIAIMSTSGDLQDE